MHHLTYFTPSPRPAPYHRDGQHEANTTNLLLISGDPPFDSYELTLYAKDGEPLPTASALQKTMVATNDRLVGNRVP